MMRKLLYFSVAMGMLTLAWNAGAVGAAQKKSTVAKKASPSAAKKKSAATTARRITTARKGTRKPTPRTTWRNRQMQPTPERYRQIQEALAAKGYLTADEATGKWDQASMDALKRFQQDQNIESTGKIDSLSLIALGLGPRHDDAPPQAKVEER
jgi:peptidoglycan hydrolase-like protein with peptidoglycan-binding domain